MPTTKKSKPLVSDTHKSTQKLRNIKSRERVRNQGEVFTPEREVKVMCDLCEPEISQIEKKVFEPGCGTGNFLVEILRRKLKNTKKDYYKILVALTSIYGVDIAEDNLEEARKRLSGEVFDYLGKKSTDKNFLLAIDTILKRNIIYGDLLEGRKNVKFVEWKPDGNGGFEVRKTTLREIEQQRNKTKNISEISKLPEEIEELFFEKPDKMPPKKKPKPQPKAQMSMFSLGEGNE